MPDDSTGLARRPGTAATYPGPEPADGWRNHRAVASVGTRAAVRSWAWSLPVLLVVGLWVVTAVAALMVTLPVFPPEAILSGFTFPLPGEARPTPDMIGRTYLLGLLVSLPLAGLLRAVAPRVHARFRPEEADRRRFQAASRWAALVVATGMPALPLALIAIPNPPGLLLAIPGSACAVWVLHRVQRHRRLPLRASLAAFGWGATFALTAGSMIQVLYNAVAGLAGHDAMLRTLREGASAGISGVLAHPIALEAAAPLSEELAKALGVALVFSLYRERFGGVVSGTVIGAMVGAGFNFIETVRFAHTSLDTAMTHIWLRQWVSGFFFGHVLFTALFGAALGLASTSAGRARRVLILGTGFALAVSSHFLWNYLSSSGAMPWRGSDPIQENFVTLPLNYLTVSGPFLVLVLVVLRLGLAREGAALRATLPIEVMTGLGAITPAEARILGDPSLRLGERLLAVRRLGLRGYLQLGRLHAAQLDLAMERWKQARGESRGGPERETQFRRQVHELKDRLHAARKGKD